MGFGKQLPMRICNGSLVPLRPPVHQHILDMDVDWIGFSASDDQGFCGAGKQEVALVVAFRPDGHGSGWSCGGAVTRLLAPEDELAGPLTELFLPGLPWLRH